MASRVPLYRPGYRVDGEFRPRFSMRVHAGRPETLGDGFMDAVCGVRLRLTEPYPKWVFYQPVLTADESSICRTCWRLAMANEGIEEVAVGG